MVATRQKRESPTTGVLNRAEVLRVLTLDRVSLRLLQAYSMVATRQERESPTTSTRKMPPTFSKPSAAAPLSGFSCAGRGPISRGIEMRGGGSNKRTEPKWEGGGYKVSSLIHRFCTGVKASFKWD